MQLNIFFLATSCQKLIEWTKEGKLCTSYKKCMASEVTADALVEEWKGYVVRVSSGNDNHSFTMKQAS